jgi:hypothetical protein
MRFAVVSFIATLLALLPARPSGASGPPSVKESPNAAVPGIGSSVFRPDDGLKRSNALMLGERLPAHATRMATPGEYLAAAQGGAGAAPAKAPWTRKNTAIAILASAVLPGMGELYCYRSSRDTWTLARVPVFLAVEGYLWYSYADNKDMGKDEKARYEAYADEHWSLDRFLANHPCCQGLGGCEGYEDYNESCKNDYNYFYYTPVEEDREEYYENIGKYNAFAFGWDDALDYGDPAFTYETPHRVEYVGIRNSSDDYLLKADQSLMGLIVNRVVSMIDTAWLSYRLSKGQDPEKGWGIRFRTFEETPVVVVNRRF